MERSRDRLDDRRRWSNRPQWNSEDVVKIVSFRGERDLKITFQRLLDSSADAGVPLQSFKVGGNLIQVGSQNP